MIIGLGNPGPKYKNTYHSAGLLFIDYLEGDKNGAWCMVHGVRLLKSDAFMNVSGSFVAKTMRKAGIRPEELLIAHDDSDLPIGEWKLSFDRGAGGHNGVASTIAELGTKAFWRARIGIRPIDKRHGSSDTRHEIRDMGRVENRRAKAGEFVLKNITKENKKKLEKSFEEIANKILSNDTKH